MKWKNGFEGLPSYKYTMIRHWRVERGATWRRVAELASEAWNGDWESNQIAGMELCEAAANHFGENYHEEPW